MSDPDRGGITTVSSRIAYSNRWTRVREDILRRADGSPGLYGVVERNDFSVVLPLDDHGRVTLVEQFRYPVGRRLIELPMGIWEERPDEPPETVAAGELAEETGLVAAHWRRLGTVYQGAGYSTQKGHVFLATGLTAGKPRRETTERDMTVLTVPLDTMRRMIADGRISDAITIAVYGLFCAAGLANAAPDGCSDDRASGAAPS